MLGDASFHHKLAAELLELAAYHHREAAKFHETGDDETGAYHAHVAQGHLVRAIDHVEEATKALPNNQQEGNPLSLASERLRRLLVREVERSTRSDAMLAL